MLKTTRPLAHTARLQQGFTTSEMGFKGYFAQQQF
jgi:hypothetical protein